MSAPAPDASALSEKAGGLKHAETHETSLTGLDPAAVEAMKKIYTDNGGDLAAISAAMGGVAFIEGATVSSADEFAIKMLGGGLLAD